jgi:DNA-binding transcriptional ArsR family regulator
LTKHLRNHILARISQPLGSKAINMDIRRDVFQAIADPTRRAIIGLIALQAMTPNAIAEHFDTSRQAVSKHIRILTECELLEQEQIGREIYYQLNPQKIKEIADFIEPFREMWDERFNKLESVMKKTQVENGTEN